MDEFLYFLYINGTKGEAQLTGNEADGCLR